MSESQPDDASTLRIMVSTDNHLGVWERDEWRSEDSFETFSEVLAIAKAEAMDFVLLGGDLFHENKPSRKTLINTLQIMHKHCLGMEPVSFQVVSDTALIQSGVDNTQDPCLNVGLPVFTIHGNHDDPSGPEHFSAVDVLSSIHYVNYFGKHTFCRDEENDIGKIKMSPLLLIKGETKVAIYGLGFMREERLARAFQMPGQVVWLRPTEDQDSWFNIFVLHQNRVQHYKTGPGQKARSIQEADLPEWLDMIVWGHEHECKQTEEESQLPNKAFNILQPGSTVATSLSEPESKPKACFCLEICSQAYRLTHRLLQTIRPFKFKAVSLAELGAEPGNHAQIEELLVQQVNELIDEVDQERAAAPTDPMCQPLGPSLHDYTGFSTVHTLRFGQRFVNRVANPSDILLWAKSSVRKPKQTAAEVNFQDMPEALDDTQIEDLVSEFAGILEIVPAPEIGEALKRFVDKDEKQSLHDTFDHILSTTKQAALEDLATAGDEEDAVLAEAGEEAAQKRIVDAVSKAGKRLQEEAEHKFAEEGTDVRVMRESAARAARGEEDGYDSKEQENESEEDDEEGGTHNHSKKASGQKKTKAGRGGTRGGRAAGRGRGSQGGGAAGRGTAAGTSRGASARSTAKKGTGRGTSNARSAASLSAFLNPTQNTQNTQAGGQRTQRAAASKSLAQRRLQQAGLDTQPTQGTQATQNGDAEMHDDLEDPIEASDDENVMHGVPQRQNRVVSESDEDFVVVDDEDDVPSASRAKKRAKVTTARGSKQKNG